MLVVAFKKSRGGEEKKKDKYMKFGQSRVIIFKLAITNKDLTAIEADLFRTKGNFLMCVMSGMLTNVLDYQFTNLDSPINLTMSLDRGS